MVTNILKNGTVIADITGCVVRIKDAEPIHTLIDQIDIEIFKEGQISDENTQPLLRGTAF